MVATALICRSYYSLLRGAVSARRWVIAAHQGGYKAIALADVNAMYGAVDLWQETEKASIKPIVGAEILTDNHRVVLLAENRRGYKNLCRIITARNLDEDFSLIERLAKWREGVICIGYERELLPELREIIEPDNLFAGCPNADEAQCAQGHGYRPVASGQFAILDDEDVVRRKILTRVRELSVEGAGPTDRGQWGKLIPAEQLAHRFAGCPEAIAHNDEISQRCNFKLITGRYLLPKVKLSNGRDANVQLSRLCHLGMAQRYRPISAEVVKRLKYELDVIAENRFSDYFLVVARIVAFAKQESIPVEVRGSAAGSLVSHVLGFTHVCPVANNLYFERFMNPGRKDCPDIDIDLCWRRRDDVIRFCYDNWGHKHVAMISLLSRYRQRSAIRDAGRALGLSPGQINDLVANKAEHADSAVYGLAEKLIDVPRHVGVHCGGIVITPAPVAEAAPLERATKGVVVTQYDKDAAEAVGLIKIDLLGNRALSTVTEAAGLIATNGGGFDVEQLDPMDPKTASMMSRGESLGVFQCESPGMRQLLRGLKVKNQKDVGIALSLIRPGPAAAGMKQEYIERHVNRKPFEYLHPKMQTVLGDTHGVMLYQEDVMRIAVEVAGYELAEANQFRSEVSKKVSPSRLQQQYARFVYGRADEAGIERHTANAIWEQILSFAAYSYCKAHATVYGNIAWQTAFLKAHYPLQFYTSLFNNHQGMYPLRVYVWDAIRHGLRVRPPHLNHSDIEWSIEGRSIRAGLNIIKGLSAATMAQIIEERHSRLFADINDLRQRVKFRGPELQRLIHVGACDGLGQTRPAMLLQSHYDSVNAKELLFDMYAIPSKQRLPDYNRLARLQAEIDFTGIPFSMHPALLLDNGYICANRLKNHIDREVKVAGLLATARTAWTKDNKLMGFVTLEDFSGLIEASFFPDRIDQYHIISSNAGPVWIKGRASMHLSTMTVEAQQCGQIRL